jgi:hypothetical protein
LNILYMGGIEHCVMSPTKYNDTRFGGLTQTINE